MKVIRMQRTKCNCFLETILLGALQAHRIYGESMCELKSPGSGGAGALIIYTKKMKVGSYFTPTPQN